MLSIDSTFIGFIFTIALGVLIVSTGIELIYRPRLKLAIYVALRLLALAALFILFREFWKVSYQDKPLKNEIVLLTDTSGSMEMLPKQTQRDVSSFKKVVQKELGDEEYKVIDLVFGSDVVEGAKKEKPANLKRSTAIGKALMTVNRNYPGSKVVLFSDGCENSGVSALAAVHRIKAYATAVYPVFASRDKADILSDLILSNVYNSMKGWSLDYCCQLNGTIEQKGQPVDSCTLDVYVDNRPVVKKTIKLGARFRNFEVNIPALKSIKPGWHEYRAVIRPLDSEATIMNNEARGIFQVFGKDQITIIWHYWDLNLRFLKKVLDEKYGKKVTIITLGRLRHMAADQQLALLDRTAFLMVGNIDSSLFTPEAKNKLHKMIKSEKISVFFMNGGCLESWLNNSLFAPLMPIAKVGRRLSSPKPWWLKLKFPFSDVPLVLPIHTAYRFEPKDEQYVKCRAISSGQDMIPVVVNKGRVTCVAPVSTWRWFINPKKNVRFEAMSFWSYMFTKFSYLQRQGMNLSAEEKETIISRLGETPYVFSVDDPRGVENGDTVDGVFLMQELSPVESKEIRRFTAKNKGEYQCSYTLDSPGIYWYFAEKRDKKGRVLDISNRFPIQIKDNNRELATITDKSDLLTQIASITQGKTFFLTDAEKLVETLKEPNSKLRIRQSHDHNYMFESIMVLLVVAFMGLEWLFRQIEKNLQA